MKPAGVFHYFEEICQVPRPSKKEEKIIAYLKAFGEKHKLETKVDEAGNVLIKKPATPGMENRKTVVLQSHIDMVCEKNNDVKHDFLTDPIETEIDGEWLKAKGTTLGADNGIGVATELAILADDSIEHGPIECLFTVDEETGLTGAFALKEGFMNGDILLNLDSEDEGELFIGCAGGIDSVAEFTYREVDVPAGYFCCKVQVKGLKGGHSGGDIHLGRGNANKLLNRFLSQASQKYDMYLCEIDGGNLRNAIAREAHAVIAIPDADKHALRTDLNVFAAEVEAEYAVVDPDLQFVLESEAARPKAIDKDTAKRLLQTIYATPRCVCHEPRHSGAGGNLHQSGLRKDETRPYHPYRDQPAQLYRPPPNKTLPIWCVLYSKWVEQPYLSATDIRAGSPTRIQKSWKWLLSPTNVCSV